MAVTVLIGGSTATCEQYEWHSTDKVLERRLSGLLSPRGPAGDDPWPDWTAAKAAVDQFGGKIVGSSDKPRFVPGRVY